MISSTISSDPDGPVSSRRTFVARLGALTQLVFAVLIATVSALAGDREPDFLPRPLVLLALFALPGVVGLLGVTRRRAGLVIAASAASAVGAFIAFSGVTLIFLVPATLLAVGATGLASGGVGGRRDAVLGLAGSVLALALLLGTGWSALLITDRACWTWRETPGGGVEVTPTAFSTGEMAVPSSATGVGCAEGLLSARGVGLATLLGGAAVTLSAIPAGRRRRT